MTEPVISGFSEQGGRRIKKSVEWVEGFVNGTPGSLDETAPLPPPSFWAEIREHDGKKYGWKRLLFGDDGGSPTDFGKATYSDPFYAREVWESEHVPIGARVELSWQGSFYIFEFHLADIPASCDEDISGGATATIKLTSFNNIEVPAKCLGEWKAGSLYATHSMGEWRVTDGGVECPATT
jgi:hypothetical protein